MIFKIFDIVQLICWSLLILFGLIQTFQSTKITDKTKKWIQKVKDGEIKFNSFNSHFRYLVDDEVRIKVNKISGIKFVILRAVLLVNRLIELKWTPSINEGGWFFAIWAPAYFIWMRLYPKVLYMEKRLQNIYNNKITGDKNVT